MKTALADGSRGSSSSRPRSHSVSPASSEVGAPSTTSSEEKSEKAAVRSAMIGLKRYEKTLRDAHIAGLRASLNFRTAQSMRNMSALAGHDVFVAVDQAQVGVSTALALMSAAHHSARELALATGIDLKAYGEMCDPKEPGVLRPAGRPAG